MLEGPKMLRRPILDVRGTTAGLKQDSESLLVLQAALAPLYGFQNLYLRLEYSSVARAIELSIFVGHWPEGPAVLKGGAMAPLARLSPWLRLCTHYTQQLCANTWIIVILL